MKIQLHIMASIVYRAKFAYVHDVSYDVIIKIGRKYPVFKYDKVTGSYNL